MGFCKDFCVGILSILLVFLAINNELADGSSWDSVLKMPIDKNEDTVDAETGTRWAVLLAGSSGFWNYRHQSDVCHAYQVLRKGGLKEENIVVFMYDDIANNEENPRPGTIINHPGGQNIYAGVPKDYTGSNVTVDNFLAVLLGDKRAVKGGSGKVVDSGPNDHIFVFYSDHGGPGVLGMPTPPYLFADDLISVLKKKHAAGSYKEMVLYIEACESGSIFEGMLPDNLNIYATTASNAVENSWGTYCPGMAPPPPPEYDTCLGDLYSVSWMEDSEIQNLKKETLAQQYNLVKFRTSNRNTYKSGSHVMQYGDIKMSREELYRYIGFDKNASNTIPSFDNALPFFNKESMAINQRDADVLFMWQKYKKSREDTQERLDAQKKLFDFISHRMHIDKSIELVGNLLFGSERGRSILKHERSPGLPLVDDWDCLKQMVRAFETHCGSLSQYGMKHMRVIANICNNGVLVDAMAKASAEACYRFPSSSWSSLHKGFSA